MHRALPARNNSKYTFLPLFYNYSVYKTSNFYAVSEIFTV